MGSVEIVDTLIRDGLWDIFNGYHMGITTPPQGLFPDVLDDQGWIEL